MGWNWDTACAHNALQQVYRQVLEREIDPTGLSYFTDRLVNKNDEMQAIVRDIGHSSEYNQRFVLPYVPQQDWGSIIRRMYKHFLNRDETDTAILVSHSNNLVEHGAYVPDGYKRLVDVFVGSPEYWSRWGNQGVPGIGPVPQKGCAPGSNGVNTYVFCVTTKSGSTSVVIAASNQAEAAKKLADQLNAKFGHNAWSARPC